MRVDNFRVSSIKFFGLANSNWFGSNSLKTYFYYLVLQYNNNTSKIFLSKSLFQKVLAKLICKNKRKKFKENFQSSNRGCNYG